MADTNVSKFEITVLSPLKLVQDELINDGMESSPTREALAELKKLSSSVSKKLLELFSWINFFTWSGHFKELKLKTV